MSSYEEEPTQVESLFLVAKAGGGGLCGVNVPEARSKEDGYVSSYSVISLRRLLHKEYLTQTLLLFVKSGNSGRSSCCLKDKAIGNASQQINIET